MWDGLNTGKGSRGHLYLDGQHRRATGLIHEPMVWDEARAMIRLGTGQFVGLMRDLALFDRPLTEEELRLLARSSVRDLY